MTYNKALDEYFMSLALKEAKKAYQKNEVPIGAIIIKDNKIISKAYNTREKKHNALAHAEILAIDKACKKLKSWRLIDCDLYVTVEPCPMCSGAIIQSRIRRLIIGTMDKKAGAAGSVINLFDIEKLNHKVDVTYDILRNDCSYILKNFFKQLRENKNK